MSESKYIDMRPLFSGASNKDNKIFYFDARSDLFVHRLLKFEKSYDIAGNTWGDNRDIFTAENYENKRGARDQEVHPDFIDFMYSVGQYHYAIDDSYAGDFGPNGVLARRMTGPANPATIKNNTNNIQTRSLHKFFTDNWNNLSGQFKKLYTFAMNLVDENNNAIELEAYFGPNGPANKDPLRVRFNMKTQNIIVGGNQVETFRFFNLIPPELRQAYYDGYQVGSYVAPTQLTELGYDIDRLFQKDLIRGMEQDSSLSSIFAELSDPAYCSRYTSSGDQIIDLETGKPVDVNAVTHANKCGTTQVKEDVNETCQGYIAQCLRGENIDQCRRYFANADFFETTLEEIRNMNPTVALRTLKTFGFLEETEYDEEYQMNITRIQPYHKWFAGLKNVTNDQATIDEIGKNDKLAQYLKWVIKLVNCNIGILNPGVTHKGNPDSEDPNRFAHTSFGQMGLKGRRAVRDSCHRDIDGLENLIKNTNVSLGIRLNAPIVGGVVPVVSMVGGGSMVTINQAETSVNQLKESRKSTAEVLETTFTYLVKKLHAFNKDISTKDKQKIHQLIKDLAIKEDELYRLMNFVEKYSVIVDVFGQDRAERTVKLDDMKKAVEARPKLFAKKVKRESDILSVLKTLAEAVEKEVDVVTNPVGTAIGFN